MQISVQDQRALIFGLSEALKSTIMSAAGAILPEMTDEFIEPDVKSKVEKYLDRGGIERFFEDQLTQMIIKSGYTPQKNQEPPVAIISGFSDYLETAKKLVRTLSTLPWTYTLYVRGPRAFSSGSVKSPFKFDVTDRFGLVSSQILSNECIFNSGDEALDGWNWRYSLKADRRFFAHRHLYFYYHFTGYIPPGGYNRASDEFEAEIRAFYGACVAHGLLFPYAEYMEDPLEIVHLKQAKSGYVQPNGSLSADINRATYFMAMAPMNKQFKSLDKFSEGLAPVRLLFNCSNSSKLRTAAIWLLRSEMSLTPMDKVLESTIALEVLLGDRDMSDRIGLTKLMSNRCAYALGSSDNERKEILSSFLEFYKLRSEIVHTGRLTISEHEETIVDWGTELASKMLQHEQALGCRNP